MSTYLERATPRQCVKWSLRTLYVSAPLSVVILLAWGSRAFDVMHEYPTLTLMVYQLLLAIAVCAAMVATLAACHLAVGRAFSAGLRAGQSEPPSLSRVPREPDLRVVE